MTEVFVIEILQDTLSELKTRVELELTDLGCSESLPLTRIGVTAGARSRQLARAQGTRVASANKRLGGPPPPACGTAVPFLVSGGDALRTPAISPPPGATPPSSAPGSSPSPSPEGSVRTVGPSPRLG